MSVDQNRVLLTAEFVLRANFFLLIVHVRPLHSSIFDGFEQHHVVFFKNYLLLTRTCKGQNDPVKYEAYKLKDKKRKQQARKKAKRIPVCTSMLPEKEN